MALCRLTEVSRGPSWSPVVFGFMGFGLIASGEFDIDPTWARLTLHGELHYASTAVTGGAVMVAAISAWRDLCHDGRQGPANCCLAIGLGCITLFLTSLVLPKAAVLGLTERLALGLGALWVAGFALSRLRTPPTGAVYVHPQMGRAQLSRHELERKGLAG